MTPELLEHPALQSLEPKTSREILLFIKAHTLGLKAACNAIQAFGLENTEALYRTALPTMWENLEALAGDVDDNAGVVAQTVDPFGEK